MHDTAPTERDVLDRIRQEMEKHLLENQAPEDVHEFLVMHWSRLMTGIFMAKGNQDADWNAGWDTVNALLWSLSPKHGRQETEKMLRMLPTILARLQEGCAAMAMPAEERDVFFERLAMMHAAVARAGLKYKAGREPGVTRMGDLDDAENRAGLAELRQPAPDKPASRPRAGCVPLDALPELKAGDRVRFHLAKEERTLILNWVSPVGGMYMFANDQGLDALTLTRARLEERFRAGTACLAETVTG